MTTLRLRHLPLDHLTRVTEPVAEVLTLAEVKAQLRILHSSEDAYLTGLIPTAREAAEADTRRALSTSTWRLTLDAVPFVRDEEWWDGVRQGAMCAEVASAMEIPRPPLQQITSITSYGADDAGQVFDPAHYYVDTTSEPGRVALRTGGVWPIATRTTNGVSIEFVAGYPSPAAVPSAIKHGMLLVIGDLYRHREHSSEGTFRPVPYDAAALWRPYVVRL